MIVSEFADMSPKDAAAHLMSLCGGPHRDIAHFVVNWVEDQLSTCRLDSIAEFINCLDPSKIKLSAASTVLRSSYRASAYLTNWMPFLTAVREHNIEEPRLDRILIGLNRPYSPPSYV